MKNTVRILALIIAVGVSLPASAQEYVYWTNSGEKKIIRNDLVGSANEDVVTTNLDVPSGIDVHYGIGKVYWTDEARKTISRADLDGSSAETIVKEGRALSDLVVAESVSKIFWIDFEQKLIRRSDLDGSNVETVVTKLAEPLAIAIDESNGKLFWTDAGEKALLKSDLDGSNIEKVVTSVESPSGVVVHETIAKVYWIDGGDNSIMRSDLDGGNIEAIVKSADELKSLAIDVVADRIYWINVSQQLLRRAFCNGAGVESVMKGLGDSNDIALIPSIALPIELEDLRAHAVDNTATLSWTVSTPADLLGFDVEHMQNDEFQVVGFIGAVAGSSFEYKLPNLTVGSHSFRLKMIRVDGDVAYSKVVELDVLTRGFALSNPYPNPTAGRTSLTISSSRESHVEVVVVDILGRIVDRLFEGPVPANSSRELVWDATNQSSGIYFIQTMGGVSSSTKKVVLSK